MHPTTLSRTDFGRTAEWMAMPVCERLDYVATVAANWGEPTAIAFAAAARLTAADLEADERKRFRRIKLPSAVVLPFPQKIRVRNV